MLVKCKTKNNEPIQIYDPDYLEDLDLKDIARYFYELGLKAGEK